MNAPRDELTFRLPGEPCAGKYAEAMGELVRTANDGELEANKRQVRSQLLIEIDKAIGDNNYSADYIESLATSYALLAGTLKGFPPAQPTRR